MLDENLSYRLARALKVVAHTSKYEIFHVRQKNPASTTDPDWLRKFAADGGTAIVSGDPKILHKPHELLAIMETGLISFFVPKKWDDLSRFGRAALVILWWPKIIVQTKNGKPSESWRIPIRFNPNVGFKKLERPSGP